MASDWDNYHFIPYFHQSVLYVELPISVSIFFFFLEGFCPKYGREWMYGALGLRIDGPLRHLGRQLSSFI